MQLVKNSYHAIAKNYILVSALELLHTALEFPNYKPINVISIYYPPNQSLRLFFEHLYNLLNNIDYANLLLIILGDFKINILNSKKSGILQFLNFIKDYGLHNITKGTTCITTQIDLILCNSLAHKFINAFTSIESGISDHNVGYKKLKIPKAPSLLHKKSHLRRF